MNSISGQSSWHSKSVTWVVQVPETAKLALEAVSEGMCVVIGLQSTGEANTNQVRELTGDAMEDFVSAPQQILLHFLEKHFPTHQPEELSEADINHLHAQVTTFSATDQSYSFLVLLTTTLASMHGLHHGEGVESTDDIVFQRVFHSTFYLFKRLPVAWLHYRSEDVVKT